MRSHFYKLRLNFHAVFKLHSRELKQIKQIKGDTKPVGSMCQRWSTGQPVSSTVILQRVGDRVARSSNSMYTK